MTSEWARPECDVRSRNALAAGTEQGSGCKIKNENCRYNGLWLVCIFRLFIISHLALT